MDSADVKVFEVVVVGEDVGRMLLDFSYVVASLVGGAEGCVKGVMLEETVEGVRIVTVVFEFGLKLVGDKVGVITVVLIVEPAVTV